MPDSPMSPPTMQTATDRLRTKRLATPKPAAEGTPPQDFTEHARNAATMLLHKHGDMAKHVVAQHIGELRKKGQSPALAAAEHVRHYLDPQDEDFAQVQAHMGSGPSAMAYARNDEPDRYGDITFGLPEVAEPVSDHGQPAPKARGYMRPPKPVSHPTMPQMVKDLTQSAPPQGTPVAKPYIAGNVPLQRHADLARANHGDNVHAKLAAAMKHFGDLAAGGDVAANRPFLASKMLAAHIGSSPQSPVALTTENHPHVPSEPESVDLDAVTKMDARGKQFAASHALPSIPHDPVLDSFYHDDQHANALTHGEEVHRQPVKSGRNGAFFVDFAGTHPGGDVRGVWKPAAMDQTEAMRHHIPAGNPHGHEAAAWETARHLGIDAVPATVSREMDRPNGGKEAGSVQNFVDAEPALYSPNAFADPDLATHAAFDHVIGNSDRHMKNWMMDSNGRAKLIDHGLSFPEFDADPRIKHVSELYRQAVDKNLPIPKNAAEWLDKWPSIERSLRRHNLNDRQIANVKQRLADVAEAAKQGKTFADLHTGYNGKVGIEGL